MRVDLTRWIIIVKLIKSNSQWERGKDTAERSDRGQRDSVTMVLIG